VIINGLAVSGGNYQYEKEEPYGSSSDTKDKSKESARPFLHILLLKIILKEHLKYNETSSKSMKNIL
jgi:hypothetical protein